jgi:hypothetical protein
MKNGIYHAYPPSKGPSINDVTLRGGGGLSKCDDLWRHYVIYNAFMWRMRDKVEGLENRPKERDP